MKKVGYLFVVLGFLLFNLSLTVVAQEPAADEVVPAAASEKVSREDLAAQTEEACTATSNVKPTSEMIIQKVDEACKLLEAEGVKAFPKFMGRNSGFVFAGTYIWIHELGGEGTMKMHPIKFKLEGKPLLIFKDNKGKRFFAEMNRVVESNGAGWVDYYWPIPGSKEVGHKVSYVKLAVTPEKEKLVVGCGIYGLSEAEIEKLVAGN